MHAPSRCTCFKKIDLACAQQTESWSSVVFRTRSWQTLNERAHSSASHDATCCTIADAAMIVSAVVYLKFEADSTTTGSVDSTLASTTLLAWATVSKTASMSGVSPSSVVSPISFTNVLKGSP